VCTVRRVINVYAPPPLTLVAWADRSDHDLHSLSARSATAEVAGGAGVETALEEWDTVEAAGSLPSRLFLDVAEGGGVSVAPGAAGVWAALAACPVSGASCHSVGGACASRRASSEVEEGSCSCSSGGARRGLGSAQDALLSALGPAAAALRGRADADEPSYACDCACGVLPPPDFWTSSAGVLAAVAVGLGLFPLGLAVWSLHRCSVGLHQALRAKAEQEEAARQRVRGAIFSVFNCRCHLYIYIYIYI